MKRLLLAMILICGSAFTTVVAGQRVVLSDHDKELAIAHGTAERGQQQGLVLTDVAQGVMQALSAFDRTGNKAGTRTGFSVILYTPTTWLEQQASNAAKEYRPFTLADITEEMLEPVIRIQVNPDIPTYVTASGMAGTSSVQHVVLRSADRTRVMQPIAKEEFPIEVRNSVGGTASFAGVRAKFLANGLRELRGPKNEEFFITVIGATGEEKNFKVKEKHLQYLK